MIIGNLGNDRRAHVRGGGVLSCVPGGGGEISVEWWVGGDDRWHRPASEITCRMSLVDASPVVRTAVRVPGGDAIGTWWAARQGRRDLAVLDVQNRSGTPFAVALVLRGSGVRDVTLDGEVVRVAGAPAVYLPRAPQFAAAVAPGGDLLAALAAGRAVAPSSAYPGATEVAFLVPVAHLVHARAAVLLGTDDSVLLAGRPVLRELSSPDAAVKGWDAIVRQQAVLDLPGGAGEAFESARRALLLWPELLRAGSDRLSSAATAARALDRCGAHGAAAPLVELLADAQGLRGGFGGADPVSTAVHAVHALATHAASSQDAEVAKRLAPLLVGGLEFLGRAWRKRRTDPAGGAAVLVAACTALLAAGEGPAAAAAAAQWERSGSPWPVPVPTCPPLPASSGGGALVPDDPCRLAAIVHGQLDRVVREQPDGSVALLAGFDEAWRGAPLQVTAVPTGRGRLSFAVRWHGSRPALLWELADPVPGHPLALTAPVLGPGWISSEPRGEALLSG